MVSEIRCTLESVQVGEEPYPMDIRWDEIIEISMSRIDAIASEIVYLYFLHPSGHYLEVTDTMTGWNDLLNVLPSQFNGIPDNLRELIHHLSVDDEPLVIYKS